MAVNSEHLKAVIIVVITIGLIIGVISLIPRQKQTEEAAVNISTSLKKTVYAPNEEINGKVEISISSFSLDTKILALIDGQTKASLDLLPIVRSAGLSYTIAGNKVKISDKIIIGINSFGLNAPTDPGNHYLSIRTDSKEDIVQFSVG